LKETNKFAPRPAILNLKETLIEKNKLRIWIKYFAK